jgi:hypothetical protein
MNTLPLWFTAGWALVAVLGVLGGAAAFLFVMLPYMRRTEAMMKAGRENAEDVAKAAEDIRAALTEMRALTKDIDRERVNRLFAALEAIPEKLEGLKKASVRDALGKL